MHINTFSFTFRFPLFSSQFFHARRKLTNSVTQIRSQRKYAKGKRYAAKIEAVSNVCT